MIAWLMALVSRIGAWLDSHDWWHYYYAHAIIAVLIQGAAVLLFWAVGLGVPAGVFAGALLGFCFYLSRKIAEYQYKEPFGKWDWPGLLWPTGAVALTTLLYFFLRLAAAIIHPH